MDLFITTGRLPAGCAGRAYYCKLEIDTSLKGGHLHWECSNLPSGLTMDPEAGIISGICKQPYLGSVLVTVCNKNNDADSDHKYYLLQIVSQGRVTNTISIKHCDNELYIMARSCEKSYQIARVVSGYELKVDVEIDIMIGDYTGFHPLNFDMGELSESYAVSLPEGDYSLLMVGINYDGHYAFDVSLNGHQLKGEAIENHQVGVVWEASSDLKNVVS